ncbi:class I SAM-dependent methyltransferase [Amycolatopsis rhabdoformis]|uniref:Class I SAM-dependent methyltransferase n=1 Tax=Amycolatopsis rhabdoformis TaxID=1448059 RepID=A0ABZ1HX64_9PSEU|nr:class I SAM-dependent methyltransferase [Amycolatopsis rhabdoformis]WSE25969.1 class I SAM-dependent methyltransferase [Amycolatopsis rhabdoformis]
MRLPRPLLIVLARQLGHPRGVLGRVLATGLNRRNRGMTRAAVEALDLRPDETAADLGFGGGLGLRLMLGAGATVHGVEISDTMLARARTTFAGHARLRLHRGTLTALPLPTASTHAVLTMNTIYFVDDLPAALSEVARVLVPGGRFVLGVGDPEFMAATAVIGHGTFHLRPLADVEKALADAGLTVHRREYVGAETPTHLFVAGK